MTKKNILVTGAAGFIGSHLVERLLSEGWSVAGLDNLDDSYDPSIKRENIREALRHPDFSLLEIDIRDGDALCEAVRLSRAQTVVHLAARAGVRPSIENPALYVDVNVRGTQNVLDAMRICGISRLIFASSSSVYGNNRKVPFSESDPVDFPISPYAATKKACELITHTYSHLYKMDVSCVRFFTVYGPRQRPEMAVHKFGRLIDEGAPVPVFGDGRSRRDYTYISDIVDGLVKIIAFTKGYEIYNLGSSAPVELCHLVSLLEGAMGKKAQVSRHAEQPGDVECTFADISKAKAAFGYEPRVNIEQGIQRFVEWFYRNKR